MRFLNPLDEHVETPLCLGQGNLKGESGLFLTLC